VDDHLRAGERLWAIGDVTGIWPLTSVGEYQGDVVAANILGEPRPANYDAVPRVTFTGPQAAAVGVTEDRFSATRRSPSESKLANVYVCVPALERLPDAAEQWSAPQGAYALGLEAGEWLQQATVAIRA